IGELSSERRTRLTEIVRAEFPALKGSWIADPTCGPTLELTVSASRTDDKEEFQFASSFDCPRAALLQWLEIWRTQSNVHYEDEDHLVLVTSRGTKMTL